MRKARSPWLHRSIRTSPNESTGRRRRTSSAGYPTGKTSLLASENSSVIHIFRKLFSDQHKRADVPPEHHTVTDSGLLRRFARCHSKAGHRFNVHEVAPAQFRSNHGRTERVHLTQLGLFAGLPRKKASRSSRPKPIPMRSSASCRRPSERTLQDGSAGRLNAGSGPIVRSRRVMCSVLTISTLRSRVEDLSYSFRHFCPPTLPTRDRPASGLLRTVPRRKPNRHSGSETLFAVGVRPTQNLIQFIVDRVGAECDKRKLTY